MSKLDQYFKKPIITKKVDITIDQVQNLKSLGLEDPKLSQIAATENTSIANDILSVSGEVIKNLQGVIEQILIENQDIPIVQEYAKEAAKLSWDPSEIIQNPAASPSPMNYNKFMALEKTVQSTVLDPRVGFLPDLNLSIFRANVATYIVKQAVLPALKNVDFLLDIQNSGILRFFLAKERQEIGTINQLIGIVRGSGRQDASTCIAAIFETAASTLKAGYDGFGGGSGKSESSIKSIRKVGEDIRRVNFITGKLRIGNTGNWLSSTQMLFSLYGDLRTFANERLFQAHTVTVQVGISKTILDYIEGMAQVSARMAALLMEQAVESTGDIEEVLTSKEAWIVRSRELMNKRAVDAEKLDLAKQIDSALPQIQQLINTLTNVNGDWQSVLQKGITQIVKDQSNTRTTKVVTVM